MLDYNHVSRVVPGSKNLSPIVWMIVSQLVKKGANAKLNSKEKARNVYLHFGGIFMLYKYLFNRGSEKTIVVFHGTDLHGYIEDLSYLQRLKYRINKWSNYILMCLCDEIYVVSNSLLLFIPFRFMAKTSVLFLGVEYEKLKVIQNKSERDLFGFVDNNNRTIKNYNLAYNYALKHNSNVLRLSGLKHVEFLSILSSLKRGLLITSFQEASPNVLKESLALGLEITSVDVGDCLDIIKRFGGKLISYNGDLIEVFEPLEGYSLEYLSIDATISQLMYE